MNQEQLEKANALSKIIALMESQINDLTNFDSVIWTNQPPRVILRTASNARYFESLESQYLDQTRVVRSLPENDGAGDLLNEDFIQVLREIKELLFECYKNRLDRAKEALEKL